MMNTAEMPPLVSCIMPTYNRRSFVPHAIRYFLRQDYENKELIIIDDGTDIVADLIPDRANIRYFRLDRKISLGAKLNLACKYAAGGIIVNWDDDDWYASRRLSYQVDVLQKDGAEVCGINRLLYYDLRHHRAHEYVYPADQRPWLLGSSLCYTRERWGRTPFADIDVGMDGLFVWGIAADRIRVLPDPTFSVHMIHDHNVSPKKTDGWAWQPYPVEEIQRIMETDYMVYHGEAEPLPVLSARDMSTVLSAPDTAKVPAAGTLTNVYACLVHEREDCVIDLVRNLHYHDPSSIILLYNGGEDTGLLRGVFPYDRFGAVIHPQPRPMKHGYLHNFALDCMGFALEHLSFDTLTIVDSDQLCIRSGYSAYLKEFFSTHARVGLLSSRPERVKEDNKTNLVALQAFREYELWRPLLQSFPGGEHKFVHWTFWPSTVFSFAAIRDLVCLFKENKEVQKIIAGTGIWATEEVILPTLVSLLGYEIASNPCSYDFVRYRQLYSLQDIDQALKREDAYWLHPIERRYDHPLRKRVRQVFHHYIPDEKEREAPEPVKQELFLPATLLNCSKSIAGWLEEGEAELLLAIALRVCQGAEGPHTMVEAGCYQGKATVLLAGAAKAISPGSRVFAIDPHDGRQGAADQGLEIFPPSLEPFVKNIETAGFSGVVEVIRSRPDEVDWEKPIDLLLIDGLHDYPSVCRDFLHFSEWINAGGYVVFHDCADYFPGVQAFVKELQATGKYRTIRQAGSLMVLQKI